MFLLNATKSRLTLVAGELLVAGSVNVHEVKFEFSDDWSGLVKTVTFRTVSDSRSVILNDEGECVIPWEVLKVSSPYLYIGLIGTRDAEVVLPTIWADLGEVRNGTEPGKDVTDPTPSVYEQVLSELGSRANNLNVKDEKLQLRSGETVLSEVELPEQGGSGTTDHSALTNRDLPDQHPIKSITGLEEALKEAGADSWEDIGESITDGVIEFDGDLTGWEYFNAGGTIFVKVSDRCMQKEQLVGATLTAFDRKTITEVITEDAVIVQSASGGNLTVVLASSGMPAFASIEGDLSGYGYPPAGSYYYYYEADDVNPASYAISISCLTGEVKTITPPPRAIPPHHRPRHPDRPNRSDHRGQSRGRERQAYRVGGGGCA